MNNLVYSPHPDAPLFANEDVQTVIQQVTNEIASGNFSTNENFRQIVHQCGLVNLWFFLKFIAGYSGPFNELNDTLHVDMCNFRQNMIEPGRKAAAFTSRGMYKTTIFTKGAPGWELVRWPDLRIELFSCIEGRSKDFFRTTREIFDSNELFAWAYPDSVPGKNAPRWNDSEFVVPNRTRRFTEPSLRPHGVGCNTQGIHGDELIIDDPIGEAQLNSERAANADMISIANWLKSNIEAGTLVVSHKTSRVFYTATRYGVQDAHTFIFDNVKEIYGFWDTINPDDVNIDDENEWYVYNRTAIENGVITFPEVYTEEKLRRVRENDPWTYYTQIENNVAESGLNELNEYKTKMFELKWSEVDGWEAWIFSQGEHEIVKLSDTYLVIPCDPGATEGRQSSKTSKSAVGVIAHDSTNRRFVIDLRSGYAKASEVFDWAYDMCVRFYDYYQKGILEEQGAFKLLDGVWKDYLRLKQEKAIKEREPVYNFYFIGQSKVGEKKAVIRNTMEPILKEGLLYVEKHIKDQIDGAIRRFPFGDLDVLDMMCLGFRGTVRPWSEGEMREQEKEDRRFYERCANAAGY